MRRSLLAILALLAALIVARPATAAIDVSPAEGLPDVWAYVFGAGGMSPTADDDADGQTNISEAIAGTNPKNAGDVIKMKSFSRSGANVTVVFTGVAGKRYEVQGTTSLTAAYSTVAGGTFSPTTTADISATVAAGTMKFFRVLVKDIDTDSDGLSDYEERLLGLNPSVANSNGGGQSDGAYVTAQLSLPDTVSIRATSAFASEDGPTPGTFEITRSRSLFAITVPYSVSGTATPGSDYIALSGSVSFAVGETSKVISVNPNTGTGAEGSESVTVTLTPPPPDLTTAYSIGNGTATVIIEPSTEATGTGLLARYYDHANPTYEHAANFGDAANYAFTRGTPTTTGTIVVTPTSGNISALQVGHVVKLSFNGGNLNNALYNNANYTVTAKTATTFTVGITAAAALPTSSSSTCNFSIQSFPHPAVIERVDSTINFEWAGGTPNGNFITPANSPDNYSTVWEGYLAPSVAGSYTFQLDADDKARVLLDTGSGLVEILEHGWNSTATVGTFKQSAPVSLAIPASAAQRYHIRVEHVETTGDARCRLQWSRDGGAFANIPQGNVFTHTSGFSYIYNRTDSTPGAMVGNIVVTLSAHPFVVGDTVQLFFSSGNLFTPANGNFHGAYVVTAVTTSTFTVGISGATLPTSQTSAANGFVVNAASATTGWFNQIYQNTTFTAPPGRVGTDNNGATTSNNGLYGAGSPDPLIGPDTFSARWTGQLQPQFTEEYTLVLVADEGATLRINGQVQEMKTAPSTLQGGSSYLYDSATGNAIISYAGSVVKPGSYVVGESLRIDPSSGNLSHAPTTSPTYSYDSATGIMEVTYSNLTTVTPGGFTAGGIIELDPTTGNIAALGATPYTILASPAPTATTFAVNVGAGLGATGTGNVTISDNRNLVITALHAAGTGTYSYDSTTGAVVVNYSSMTGMPPGSFAVGGSVQLDPTSGNIGALNNATYTISAATATTFTVSVAPGSGNSTGSINIVDPRTGIVPDAFTAAFSVNVGAGRYANASVGGTNIEIVNKPLKEWGAFTTERYCRIPMIGGARYDIQLDYWDNAGFSRCILSWYSPSQPRQVIPSSRLYPSSSPQAPSTYVSPTDATALAGGVFSYPVNGSNGAVVSLSGAPAWLTFSGGMLTGTPPSGSAGDYQILVTLTNGAGTSTSVLNLKVDENPGNVVREFWTGVAGNSVASIPTGTAPSGTANLSNLQAPTDFGDNYGARIRGFITAPADGNYCFWISASNSAELWISNDAEPVNTFKRAQVTTGSSTPLAWNVEAGQKSPLLALEQGKKYYFEILHKAGTGAGDNLAIGWLKPGQASSTPSEIVPGYVLSPYVAPAPGSSPGTLYIATMLAQNGAVTKGVGTATMRLSEDESFVLVKYTYSGLSGILTDWHIHNDSFLGQSAGILYDPNAPSAGSGPQPDNNPPAVTSHKWVIPATGVGGLSKANIIELIKQGKSYINLHTALYPAGEIRGNFTLANGTRTFTPPPAAPAWTTDHTTNNGASRFLSQATFGANAADIAALKAMTSYEAWIDNQFTLPVTQHLPETLAREIADVFGPFDVKVAFNTWWKSSISAPDQLRQRVAFALSQIHVVSGQGPLEDNSRALSDFYDTLLTNAFGNFRDILRGTTLTPAMGRYLDMLRNDKQDLSIGRIPNENYAREIKQLFSIGLFRMWPDGTLMLNSQDAPIDTYTQREIVGLAHVFTGWDYGYDGAYRTGFGAAADWTRPMREIPARHDTGPKRVLNNEVLPGLQSLNGQPLDANATHPSTVINDPAYQGLAAQEFDAVHDMLFNHPNTGPFVCRQLIQRMVTSHPSRDYLYRVVQKFNDNGLGVRGDMKAVIKAILLDYEARSTAPMSNVAYGKQREPILRVAQAARAFRPGNISGTYSQTGALSSSNLPIITITTTSAHLLQPGNNVFLEFTDTTADPAKPAPTTGTYTVVTVPNATSYTIHAPGWISGTYNQTAGSSTMTITLNGHWLPALGQAYFDFLTGGANGVVGFDQTVRTVLSSTAVDFPGGSGNNAGSTFTIAAPNTTAKSGNVLISRFNGTYQTVGGEYFIDTVYGSAGTYGTMADHHLSVGDSVFLNFITTRDTTSGNPTTTANDLVYPIVSVPDLNTFTVTRGTAPNAAINSDNQVFVFPLKAQPLVRNGTVNARAGTFTMDNTDGDLQQTPLNSPTVFNYFLPEYKFAGALASQGITTPEFELTSETTVVRQANFIYNGLFQPDNPTTSSFKNGSNSLVIDLNPWMGNASSTTAGSVGAILGAGPQTGQRWTSNANLSTLIDRLSTVLMAGQLPAAAKTEIINFIGRPIASISVGNPCTITIGAAHGLRTGDSVTITGVTGGTFSPAINNTFTITVPNGSTTTFTVPVNCSSITSPSALVLTNSNAGIVPYNNGSPSTQNIRDRLRAIIHLILTSPDYTVQQ